MRKNSFNLASILIAGFLALLFAGCATSKCCKMNSSSNSIPFGKADGKTISLYTLKNSKGAEAQICNYGGIVTSLKVADKNGDFSDVVLGYDNLESYIKATPYFGCLVGRYGNRIAGGKFALNGKDYWLAKNNEQNSLHGGVKGFDKVVWNVVEATDNSLTLQYTSKHLEEGFPGNLSVKALYSLTDENALRLEFMATTDADTHCNLTHHSYFNFAGKGDILGHIVTINADKFTPVDANLIPTGDVRPVKGTPFDFTSPTAIGLRIENVDEQLQFGKGYDHNWVLNQSSARALTHAATVSEPTSGRVMDVWTTEPGMQFYTGNFLDSTIMGKGGLTYAFRNGFCMEPQHYPDSPNHPAFPSTVLKPGQTYKNIIIYKFSVK